LATKADELLPIGDYRLREVTAAISKRKSGCHEVVSFHVFGFTFLRVSAFLFSF